MYRTIQYRDICCWRPDVALTTHVGVVAYFSCATVAHVRAALPRAGLRLNCLGMLAVALATGALHIALR